MRFTKKKLKFKAKNAVLAELKRVFLTRQNVKAMSRRHS